MIAGMLVLAISLSAPAQPQTLAQRWRHAGVNALPESRRLTAGTAATPPVVLLHALAVHELNVRGRYSLGEPAPQPPPSWWQRLLQWVGDLWGKLWKEAFGRVRLGRIGVVSIGDALIALTALAFILVAVRLLAELQIQRGSPTHGGRPLSSFESAHDLYVQACALARKGEYAAAVRLLFSATVAALDSRGVLRDDCSSTVRELRTALQGYDSGLVPAFNDVAVAFIAGTYAERPLEASEWERASQAYRGIASDVPA